MGTPAVSSVTRYTSGILQSVLAQASTVKALGPLQVSAPCTPRPSGKSSVVVRSSINGAPLCAIVTWKVWLAGHAGSSAGAPPWPPLALALAPAAASGSEVEGPH